MPLAVHGAEMQRHLDDHAAIGRDDRRCEQHGVFQFGMRLHFRQVFVRQIERICPKRYVRLLDHTFD